MFDAVKIEYAFAYLMKKQVGSRGGPHDAHVFRAGERRDLGDLLNAASAYLQTRIERIKFARREDENGGAKARLEVAARSLERQGEELQNMAGEEPDEYHWEIIGSFVHTVAALLDPVEGKVAAAG
jgi:hypothetical protein